MVHMRNIISVFLLAFVMFFTLPANAEWKLFNDDFEEENKNTDTIPKTPPTHANPTEKQPITVTPPSETGNKQPVTTENKPQKEKTVPYCWHYSYLYNKNIIIPNEIKNPAPKKDLSKTIHPSKPANEQEKNRFSLMVAVAMGYMSAIQDVTRARMDVKVMLKDLNGFCTQYPKAPYEDAVRAVTKVQQSVQELIINEKKIWEKQQRQIGAAPSVY